MIVISIKNVHLNDIMEHLFAIIDIISFYTKNGLSQINIRKATVCMWTMRQRVYIWKNYTPQKRVCFIWRVYCMSFNRGKNLVSVLQM